MANPPLVIQPEIAEALANGDTVVGLESTLIAHGLPWPTNWETAQSAEQAIRDEGGMPATIGIWHGQPIIGMEASQIEFFARTPDVMRATRRDLASVMMQSQHAATTVAATIVLANQAGIQVVATGGLGGAHRATTWEESTFWDVSADLWELARVPVLVVCSGIKSILDIARTLEILESYSVPVAAYGTDQFPAFYLRDSGLKAPARLDTPEQAAQWAQRHWQLGGGGLLLAQPASAEVALAPDELSSALARAERATREANVTGSRLTPFLLHQLAELTKGRTLIANRQLVEDNARLAAKVARIWRKYPSCGASMGT